MNVLVINAGSSSLKYQFFKMPQQQPLSTGLIEKIGSQEALIKHKVLINGQEKVFEYQAFVPDHSAGLERVIALLSGAGTGVITDASAIEAVGHRVVHGGSYFSEPVILTKEVKERIRELSALAPLHNPVSLECIELAEGIFPNARHVAIFDTAFHQTIPRSAFMYAIPPSFYEQEQIRAYGFHGTSHDHVSRKTMEWLQKADSKIISIHLGNGCSITAVRDGKSVDTSMGFGPLSGLVMGTRSGDIDPSVIFHLLGSGKYTAEQISDLLNKQSGLLGFTGSNDMRAVRKKQEEGNAAASLILEMYVYRIKKYIGAYIAALNGVDAIVFTAGVGENDQRIRAGVCREMEYLGIHLDEGKNEGAQTGIREINTEGAKVKILVVPTNEELEIALQTYRLCMEQFV
jgi:acetate kinase